MALVRFQRDTAYESHGLTQSRFSLRADFSSHTFAVLLRTDLFSHTQFTLWLVLAFLQIMNRKIQRFLRLDFCMKEIASRSYMLMMQFSCGNLDTITLLLLLENS